MNKKLLEGGRQSYMEPGEIYFWTATITGWKHLLSDDSYKDIIIGSLKYLSDQSLMDIFAFVIMPNHIHLIWRMKQLNGKETPQASFLKFTAHEFKKKLKKEYPEWLSAYRVDAVNKSYEFWQRDPLAIRLYSPKITWQKLDYIHNNPLATHWNLATDPCKYNYSTAKFYEDNKIDFTFIKDIRTEFS
jgi:putative transposase